MQHGDQLLGIVAFNPKRTIRSLTIWLNVLAGYGNPTALAELTPGEVVLDLGSGGGIDVLLSASRWPDRQGLRTRHDRRDARARA
jgi:hypothetical protein